MSVKNYYPDLPVIAYLRTTIDMPTVVAFAKSLAGKHNLEVIRTAYCIFRNESANGKSGVNDNYIGLQADVGVWEGLSLADVVGTCVRVDGAGDTRRFICFNGNGYKVCFEFLCSNVLARGMYIGALGVSDAEDLYHIYQKKWVSDPKEDTAEAKTDFVSLYHSSVTAIPSGFCATPPEPVDTSRKSMSTPTQKIQAALGLEPDDWFGENTSAAVEAEKQASLARVGARQHPEGGGGSAGDASGSTPTQKIQAALGLEPDDWFGEKTSAAVEVEKQASLARVKARQNPGGTGGNAGDAQDGSTDGEQVSPPDDSDLIFNHWPLEADAEDFFRYPPNLTYIPVPWPMHMDADKITQIQCNIKVAASLRRIFEAIRKLYHNDQNSIDAAGLDAYDGCYADRSVRGDAGKRSMHAYGAAIDLDAADNPLGAQLGKMPKAVVDIFKAEGWRWGGDYQGRKDWMHFEACV